MTVQIRQLYRDNDPRLAGRTLRVVGFDSADPDSVVLETETNPDDIQRLLDDSEPGTRSYTPSDRRGKSTRISRARLESRSFSLVEEPPVVSGPV